MFETTIELYNFITNVKVTLSWTSLIKLIFPFQLNYTTTAHNYMVWKISIAHFFEPIQN